MFRMNLQLRYNWTYIIYNDFSMVWMESNKYLSCTDWHSALNQADRSPFCTTLPCASETGCGSTYSVPFTSEFQLLFMCLHLRASSHISQIQTLHGGLASVQGFQPSVPLCAYPAGSCCIITARQSGDYVLIHGVQCFFIKNETFYGKILTDQYFQFLLNILHFSIHFYQNLPPKPILKILGTFFTCQKSLFFLANMIYGQQYSSTCL